MRFVDTNILVYSIGSQPAAKCDTARTLLAADDLVISVQVLQEFYVQSTRPTRPNRLSHTLAVALMHTWRRFPVLPLSESTLDFALELCARHHISYWDAAIVASAAQANCAELLTEDLQAGNVLAGVRIVNPFSCA